MPGKRSFKELPSRLLAWYDQHARDLPWRVAPAERALGKRPDPYRIWLSEIMLQQTTIPHGTPYFHAFTQRWPTVEALANSRDEEVMTAWAGLGYYARARNLLKCAREVVALGGFPETEKALVKLPGIGPYTAGAIAAIAFDRQAAAVDGNVDRVFARLLALKGDWAEAKKVIAAEVRALVPEKRPGEFAEALMDLGATVCTPTRPNCLICPLATMCAARAEGEPDTYPRKPAKAATKVRFGVAYVLLEGGEVMLVRRPDKGLLGGMLALPCTDWPKTGMPEEAPPVGAGWEIIGEVRHVFTHFALILTVKRARLKAKRPDGVWTPIRDVEGLPSVFAKALRLAVPEA
ncbi:A/G-specific adenine glycosylase [Hyphomonas oceanitis]|uniref:Adenine DNA glycosylase n=1 Tax=Hyphomonas oceanitis SCH89 TaxID=1280953 RepID=A0A059G989_9PROT|nr:A/G-specific adenine glycosylase [Hyphomonas oceanitis]KDA03048.1 A/G-specific adenine glycosylase [Hyphomonas oceanitis SCH89]